MQVQCIQGGEDALNSLLYAQPSPDIIQYMQAKLQNVYNAATNIGKSFIDSATRLFNTTYSDEALDRAKRYLIQSDYALQSNVITGVNMDTYYNINPLMQSYVMEYPIINDLNNRNLCHGFQDTYVDLEPDLQGEDRSGFQRVVDGVLRFGKKFVPYNEDDIVDEETEGYINYYSNSDPTEITVTEQVGVLDLWHVVNELIILEEDPTNLEGD